MNEVKLSSSLFYNGIWAYLNRQPFEEVEGLIQAIRAEVQPQEEAAKQAANDPSE